jgi:hypothetical protein
MDDERLRRRVLRRLLLLALVEVRRGCAGLLG